MSQTEHTTDAAITAARKERDAAVSRANLNEANALTLRLRLAQSDHAAVETLRGELKDAQAEAAGSETIDEDGNVQQTPQTAPSGLEHFLDKALHLAASEDGKSVLLHVCSTFVENAVGTYLEKTAGSNTFDDFFAAALAASNREGTAVGAFPNPGTLFQAPFVTSTGH